MHLLLVEDDPVIGEATKLHLERHDYDVTWLTDGLDAGTR
ncbi:DNA-binding response OmpR family regulator [Nocardioides panaciterrulae]|uniref:DNA-binding response OmpR family regulator n=1 Tax=Nocardioides panaciterrulae TaxID=661492 RepID=A0A7Y9EA98_9ACTN|nr:DNA-binding response OmpR family regulator [Nocardioides panaciterrulae]